MKSWTDASRPPIAVGVARSLVKAWWVIEAGFTFRGLFLLTVMAGWAKRRSQLKGSSRPGHGCRPTRTSEPDDAAVEPQPEEDRERNCKSGDETVP